MANEDTYHLGIKALIRDADGKILLLQVNPAMLRDETKDYWDLPGGRVQRDQTVLDTLKREVAEETGISDVTDAKSIGMVLSNIRIPLGNEESAGLILGIYECKVAVNTGVVLSNEHVAYEWFTPEAAAHLLEVKYPKYFCEIVEDL